MGDIRIIPSWTDEKANKTHENGFEVSGAIFAKWNEHRALMGRPVSNESDTADGFGREQAFEKGLMSWYHRSPEAFMVYGLIGKRWLELGREAFGYPIIDESDTGDGHGRYNHFRGYNAADESLKGESSIFFKPEVGAHEVYGAIRDRWAQMGWEKSPAGYPISPEQDHQDGPPGRWQRFEHGFFTWAPDGAEAVYEDLDQHAGLFIKLDNNSTELPQLRNGYTPQGDRWRPHDSLRLSILNEPTENGVNPNWRVVAEFISDVGGGFGFGFGENPGSTFQEVDRKLCGQPVSGTRVKVESLTSHRTLERDLSAWIWYRSDCPQP